MKKILAILIALLAALAVQTVAFADGELLPQTAETQGETSNGAVVLAEGSIEYNGINYTVLTVPSGGENGTVEVGRNPYASGDITIPATITDGKNTYTVTSIGDGAFGNCYIYSVYIPDSVTSIGDRAFLNCSGLPSIDIPDSVTSIGDYAFSECRGLTSVDISDSVTSIGNGAFEICDSLTSITIPDGVTSIGNSAFDNCDSLTSVTIPDSVTSIGDYAFSECSGLTSVTIPDGVTSIGNRAFSWCSGLTSVTFQGVEPPTFDGDPFLGCPLLGTISLSADMTQEQRAEWEEVLKRVIPEGCQIEYTDLTPDPEPTPTPDPTPTTPPADTNTAAEAASAPTVQQMESAERPDPQDVEATERYSFWMGVKADLRAAADGKTLRVHVPADYTNMPASVMEQIRLLDADVTVDLRWNGERLTITPATAQRKTALKAFWTFAQLCELYAQ